MKGVLHEKLPGYVDERMWRDRYGGTTEEAYTNILKHIGLIYVLSREGLVKIIYLTSATRNVGTWYQVTI